MLQSLVSCKSFVTVSSNWRSNKHILIIMHYNVQQQQRNSNYWHCHTAVYTEVTRLSSRVVMSRSSCTAPIVLNGGVLSCLILSSPWYCLLAWKYLHRTIVTFPVFSWCMSYICATATPVPSPSSPVAQVTPWWLCVCCCCCFRHCWRAHDSGSLSSNWHGWWRLLTPSVDRARSPRPPPSTWRPSPATPPPARSTPLTRSVMPRPARCKSIAPPLAAVTIRTYFCLEAHCLAYGNNEWSV